MVAEALAEYDALFQKFRYHHLQLIYRTLGPAITSLKGHAVERLTMGLHTPFFPELWDIRRQMTVSWGGEYGMVRPAIGP
jgi:tryptophan 2,3-dioxygenase